MNTQRRNSLTKGRIFVNNNVFKNSRIVPFGYEASGDDPNILIPIPEQIQLLEKAYQYLDAKQPVRRVAAWLKDVSNRSISHTALLRRYKAQRSGKTTLRPVLLEVHDDGRV